MREVPARPADLPDAFVGILPHPLEMCEHRGQELAGHRVVRGKIAAVLRQIRLRRGPARVEHFAEHVELELLARRVADPHRLRALVAGQPVELHLREPALAADAVHDLEVAGMSGHRPLQPLLPRRGLLEVAREQRATAA